MTTRLEEHATTVHGLRAGEEVEARHVVDHRTGLWYHEAEDLWLSIDEDGDTSSPLEPAPQLEHTPEGWGTEDYPGGPYYDGDGNLR